jgi:EpsI family protein
MVARALILVAMMAAAGVYGAGASGDEASVTRTPLSDLPTTIGAWQGRDTKPFDSDVVAALGVDDYINRHYERNGGASVALYVGYYASQRQGDTIHSPLNCLPGAGWEPVSNTKLTFPDPRDPAGPALTVNRVMIQKGLEKQLVLYWYQSHGRIVASEYWGRFYLMADAMRLNRTDGSIVRVIAPVASAGPDRESVAERLAVEFISLLLPALDGYLPE